MHKLIVCLGYDLEADGSIPPLLGNRLIDSVDLCRKTPGATLLLMGNISYRDAGLGLPTQAAVMREYLGRNFRKELKQSNILTEDETTSSVSQIVYLKELVDAGKFSLSPAE